MNNHETAPATLPAEHVWFSQAAIDVTAERRRQMEVEGFCTRQDDEYVKGELPAAAIVYALAHSKCGKLTLGEFTGLADRLWPFAPAWLKAGDKRRDLVKAAALLIAEIERLDRAKPAKAEAAPASGAR